MMPIVAKLITWATNIGHSLLSTDHKPVGLNESSSNLSGDKSNPGTLTFKTSKVIATANTPSLKASRRPVSLSSILDRLGGFFGSSFRRIWHLPYINILSQRCCKLVHVSLNLR